MDFPDIKIEKNIPIPEKFGRLRFGQKPPRYPFEQMLELNDSFFIAFGDEDPKVVSHRLRSAASAAGKRMNAVFQCVQVTEELKVLGKKQAVQGVRVWRVDDPKRKNPEARIRYVPPAPKKAKGRR